MESRSHGSATQGANRGGERAQWGGVGASPASRPASASWADLEAELDRWGAASRRAAFWWRDDDATDETPALRHLLSMVDDAGIAIGLAVVPAALVDGLIDRLGGSAGAVVLQHGFAHLNHAPDDAKKAEFGPHREPAAMIAELRRGIARLRAVFGDRFLAVLAPPWNRIAGDLIGMLPEAGFEGLSTFGPRPAGEPVPGLRQINAHVDLIDWRGGRGFIGEAAGLGAVVAHLRARREGQADGTEPTGLLTHHLEHGDDAWQFIARLVRCIADHPAARWLAPREALWAS